MFPDNPSAGVNAMSGIKTTRNRSYLPNHQGSAVASFRRIISTSSSFEKFTAGATSIS